MMGIDNPEQAGNDAKWTIDLRIISSSFRPNALIEGPELNVAGLLAILTPDLRSPVIVWDGGTLPITGTLIVRNVDRLDGVRRKELDEWMTRSASAVQVIATCSQRLFTFVQRGAFPSDLYYRLNLVRIDGMLHRDGHAYAPTRSADAPELTHARPVGGSRSSASRLG